MVPQSTHLMLLVLECSTGAWIPNAAIVHMIDGSDRIDAPLALSSPPSVFSNPNPKIIPTAISLPSSSLIVLLINLLLHKLHQRRH
jgi:hypothetical protein